MPSKIRKERLYFSPSFRASSSRPILERPSRPLRWAIFISSALVLGVDPPVRLRLATAAACLPNAVRVFLGMLALVFLLLVDFWSFLTLRRAACRCLVVAIASTYPRSPDATALAHL